MQTGVTLIVVLDMIITILIIVLFGLTYEDSRQEVIASIEAERPKTDYYDPHPFNVRFNMFTVLTDGFVIVLYLAKSISGLRFVWEACFPPEKEFDFRYDKEAGDARWEIRLAKAKRAKLVQYFYISANSMIFVLFLNLMLLGIFSASIDRWWKYITLSALNLLQLTVLMRYIYLLMSELDSDITEMCHIQKEKQQELEAATRVERAKIKIQNFGLARATTA